MTDQVTAQPENQAIVDAFVAAISHLELDPTRTSVARHQTTWYFVHPQGREGAPITHEFFPYDVPATEMIEMARSLSAGSPHLIIPLGARINRETEIYLSRGYERTGAWEVMARPLSTPLAQPGDERALAITDAATEDRVLRAVLPDGGTGHPTTGGLIANPAVRQRWTEDGGEPAAIGRLVVCGDIAYLGDVATAPAYRRRGHAGAITRRLLDDALAARAKRCILVTTEMAHDLYRNLGFRDVMPMVEFRTPKS
jgi:ribosomal protein S18 acetylase RimI-like enzyme